MSSWRLCCSQLLHLEKTKCFHIKKRSHRLHNVRLSVSLITQNLNRIFTCKVKRWGQWSEVNILRCSSKAFNCFSFCFVLFWLRSLLKSTGFSQRAAMNCMLADNSETKALSRPGSNICLGVDRWGKCECSQDALRMYLRSDHILKWSLIKCGYKNQTTNFELFGLRSGLVTLAGVAYVICDTAHVCSDTAHVCRLGKKTNYQVHQGHGNTNLVQLILTASGSDTVNRMLVSHARTGMDIKMQPKPGVWCGHTILFAVWMQMCLGHIWRPVYSELISSEFHNNHF